MSELPKKGRIVMYGAGGCGINTVSYYNDNSVIEQSAELNDEQGQPISPITAEIKTVYIDASHSNLQEKFRDEDVFILPNVDGSGKVRRENHKEITKVIKQVLLQHEPGDFNVVVFSASGGY